LSIFQLIFLLPTSLFYSKCGLTSLVSFTGAGAAGDPAAHVAEEEAGGAQAIGDAGAAEGNIKLIINSIVC
jgi:hypothetical protein